MRYDSPVEYPFWMLSLVAATLLFLAMSLTDAKPLAEVIRVLQIGISLTVAVVYLPEAVKRSFKPKLDATDYLLIGIFLGWTQQAFWGVWILLWRLSGQPAWMVNNDFLNGLLGLMIYAGILHFVAPGAVGGDIPRKRMIFIGGVVGAACLAGLLLMLYSPSVSRMLHLIRPYVEQPHHGYEAGNG